MYGAHFSEIFINATAAPRAVAGRGESSALYVISSAFMRPAADGAV